MRKDESVQLFRGTTLHSMGFTWHFYLSINRLLDNGQMPATPTLFGLLLAEDTYSRSPYGFSPDYRSLLWIRRLQRVLFVAFHF